MICKNCGNELAEGIKFCGVCGAKIEAEDLFSSSNTSTDVVENVQAEEQETGFANTEENNGFSVDISEAENQPDYDFFNQPEEPVKKKKKWPIVLAIGGAIVAVIVALVIIFWDTAMAFWMHLQPAEKQLQYTYYRFATNTTSSVADSYQNSLDNTDKPMSTKGSVTLEINGIAKDFIGDNLGVSLGELSKVSIDYALDYKDSQYSFDATLKADKEKLLEVEGYLDMTENEIILDLPGILDSPVKFEIPESEGSEAFAALNTMDMEMVKAILPDSELLKKLVPRLVEVAFQEITDVSAENDEIEAGDVKVNATCLEAEISEKTIVKMVAAVISELEENKDFKAYIETFVKNLEEYSDELELEDFDSDEIIDEIYDGLKEAKKEIKDVDASSKTLLSIRTYVDFHYNILGVEVEVEQMNAEVGFFAINHGGKLGYEIFAEANGNTIIEIVGNGNKKGDIYSVKFEFDAAIDGVDCVNLLTLDVKNFDTKAFSEGLLKGSFELSASDTLLDQAGLSVVNFASPSIKFTFDGELNKSSKCTVSLNVSGQAIVSLIFDSTMSDKATITIPEGAVDSDEVEFNEDALEDFVEKFEDLGLPLVDIVGSLGENSYDDSYDDYYDDDYYDDDYYDDYYADDYDDYYDDYYDDDYVVEYDEGYYDEYLSEEDMEELENLWGELF